MEAKMKSHIRIALLTLAAFAPLVAQTPKGWKMRVDRSTAATDPQAAVYWNPTNTVAGSYTLKGSFTLMKPSGHNNYYGLVFGGSGLEGAQQSYLYFVIGQNGSWLIK